MKFSIHKRRNPSRVRDILFKITGRAEGKTTAVVKWLERHPDGVILTANEQMAELIRKQIKRGYYYSETAGGEVVLSREALRAQVMSFRTAKTKLVGKRNVLIAIDNLDLILANALGIGPMQRIDFVTATGDLDG